MSLLLSTGAFASSLSGAAPGMVLVSPTSITHSGTSATLGANGQVTFTAVTSLSLNGVFSADFDNYVIYWRGTGTSGARVDVRLRASGSDASGTDYTTQRLFAQNASISAERVSSQNYGPGSYRGSSDVSSVSIAVYGPNLAQPTAFRTLGTHGFSTELIDEAGTHSLSTAYDGVTLFNNTVTGACAVYGIRS